MVAIPQSYRFYPAETTEASQVEAAMRVYGVLPDPAKRYD